MIEQTISKAVYCGMTTMYQWAKDYDQELLPKSLISDFDKLLDKLIHGKEIDETEVCYLKRRLIQERGKTFWN